MSSAEKVIINQHPFTRHVTANGAHFGECGTCGVIVVWCNAAIHVESAHGAVEEVVDNRQVQMFDERVADRTYPQKYSHITDGYKQWLIEVANAARDELVDKNGTVSSPEIQRLMLTRYPEETEGLEWRFLGGLWKSKKFTKTGEFREASHGRMAPVWRRV